MFPIFPFLYWDCLDLCQSNCLSLLSTRNTDIWYPRNIEISDILEIFQEYRYLISEKYWGNKFHDFHWHETFNNSVLTVNIYFQSFNLASIKVDNIGRIACAIWSLLSALSLCVCHSVSACTILSLHASLAQVQLGDYSVNLKLENGPSFQARITFPDGMSARPSPTADLLLDYFLQIVNIFFL